MPAVTVTKRTSQKVILQVSIGGIFTDFLAILKLDGPDGEQLYDDLTCLDSDWVEDGELIGLSTPGSIKVEGFYDPQNTMQQLIVAQVVSAASSYQSFKVLDKIGTGVATTAFTGSFKNFPVTREAKKMMRMAFEIKLRSPMALTPAP